MSWNHPESISKPMVRRWDSNSMLSGPGYPAYLIVETNPDALVKAGFESGQLRA